MRWWRRKRPERELCDDCGVRPAVTRQDTLLLCAGCAGQDDGLDDDGEPIYWDGEDQ